MLCCVRNVAWIMDSFERLVRRNAFEPSSIFASPEERATVYSRTEALAHRDRVVGFACSALKEAYYGEHSDHLLLIDYDILTQKPEACLRLIYRFLGEEWFDHNFERVEYDEPEFDRRLGAPGLHTVSGRVRHQPRNAVLPPDLFERFDRLTFWDDPAAAPPGALDGVAPVRHFRAGGARAPDVTIASDTGDSRIRPSRSARAQRARH